MPTTPTNTPITAEQFWEEFERRRKLNPRAFSEQVRKHLAQADPEQFLDTVRKWGGPRPKKPGGPPK